VGVLNESDRGIVLAGAAYLDESLKALLAASLVKDVEVIGALLNTDKPLGTFLPA
jgi:hypothetical protein